MNTILVFAGSTGKTTETTTGDAIYSQESGIYVFRMDPDTGVLTRLNYMSGEPDPTYLTIDRTKRFLYAVNELQTYSGLETAAASAYAINAENGTLTLLNRCITGGTDACYITMNDANTHLLIANYTSGSICIMPMEQEGTLGKFSCFLQHKGSSMDPVRQKSPHPHSVVLDKSNRRILVPDLGTDEIVIYDVDWEKGYLRTCDEKNPKISEGEGPRHCVFNSSGKILYVISEMGSSICVFSYEETTGHIKLLQKISTLPKDFIGINSSAAIRLHPNGELLYGSNRGHDSLATYRIDKDTGLLALLSIQPTGGQSPRDFNIDPSGKFLIAANQASDNLVVFRIDEVTGWLTEIFREINVHNITCVLISEL